MSAERPHALITGGATRNPVDAIRYMSAHATGATAVAIAMALGGSHRLRLLGSAEANLRAALADPSIPTTEYTSTRDLMAKMEEELRGNPGGVLVHSAAVGDYEANAAATKVPSGQPELMLRLTPTPKIVDRVREWSPDVFLVSFKAGNPEWDEERLEAVARAQLTRTRSDLVFANRLGALSTSCLLVSASTTTRFEHRGDAVRQLAERIKGTRPR